MLFSSTYPVTCNTQHVGPGSIFVAIKGFKEDGTTYISQAIQQGATTIIVDRAYAPHNIPPHIKFIVVDDTRKALAEYASNALDNPAQKLKLIGITGTAGKTTTTYLIDHILTNVGYKTALMGSIKNKIGTNEEESSLTSPSADYIQMFLAECVKQKVDYVVMEISSHSIALLRTYGISFDAVGFTNLSPEHMDFHPTLEHYFQTKVSLFRQLKNTGIAVINSDNEWGQKALKYFSLHNLPQKVFSFGSIAQQKEEPHQQHVNFSIKHNSLNGIAITSEKIKTLTCSTLFGTYNAYNICMATLICLNLDLPLQKIQDALSSFSGVPGRLQVHTLKSGAKAFVDFAHKPGAFEEVLKTLRPLSSHLIVVFGCGGNRDKTKRPIMGKLAAQYADEVIISDDNPRDEDHDAIAHEIFAGIPQNKTSSVTVELDRRKAIALAVQHAQAHSIIAILGKGHESYYLVQGKKYHLDDLEEIRRF